MNIVFDLGGVVFTWDPEALIAKVFKEPDICNKVITGVLQHRSWLDLDRGTVSPEAFAERAERRTGLDAAGINDLLRKAPYTTVIIADTVDLLYRLKAKDHSLFYLSNMHLSTIKYLESSYEIWDVFEGGIISCHVQLAKPDPEIYAHFLNKYQFEGSDIVFIDDAEANL